MADPHKRLRRRSTVDDAEQPDDRRKGESNASSTRKSQHQVTWGASVIDNDKAQTSKHRHGINLRRQTGPTLDRGGTPRCGRQSDANVSVRANRSDSFVKCPSIRSICSDDDVRRNTQNKRDDNADDAEEEEEEGDEEAEDDESVDEVTVVSVNNAEGSESATFEEEPEPRDLTPSIFRQDAAEQTIGVELQESHVQTDDSDVASSEPETEATVGRKRSVASDTSLLESVREWVGENNLQANRPTTRSTSSQTVLKRFYKWWGGMNNEWCRDDDDIAELPGNGRNKYYDRHRCSSRGDGRGSKGNTVEDRRWKRLPTLSDKLSISDEDSPIESPPWRSQHFDAPKRLSRRSDAQSEIVEARNWQLTECEPRDRSRPRSTSAHRSVDIQNESRFDGECRPMNSRTRKRSKPITRVTRMNWNPAECEPPQTRSQRRYTDINCEPPVRLATSDSTLMSDDMESRHYIRDDYCSPRHSCAPRNICTMRRSRASETPRWAQCDYECPPGVDFRDDEAEWRRRHSYQPPPQFAPSGECKELYRPERARYTQDTCQQPIRSSKGKEAYADRSTTSLMADEPGAPFQKRLVYNIAIFMATFAFWVQMTTILQMLKTMPDDRGAIRHTQTAIEGLQLCATLILGRLHDVCGSRVVLSAGFVLAAISHVLMAMAANDVTFCVARLLTVGVPYLLDAQLTLVDLSSANDVTGPIAFATLSYGLGMHVGTAIMPDARNYLGQRRDLLLITGFTPVLSLLLIELFGDKYYTTRPTSTDKLQQVMNLTRMLTPITQSSRVCILLAVQALFSSALFMFQGIFPLAAVSQLDMPQRDVNILIRVASIVTVLTPCLGTFAIQPGKSYMRLLQFANVTLVLFYILAAYAVDLSRFYAVFIPLSMSSSIVDMLLTGALLVVAPTGQAGSVLGLNMAIITLAKLYGPNMGSALMSLHGFSGICVVGVLTSAINSLLLVVFTFT